MQQKSDPHIFTGMQRDLSVSKHKPESLYDAMNLRFTPRDGDTMLSITNEKGTTKMKRIVDELPVDIQLEGTYLGHCVIKDYVVVFTHGASDHIYKVTPLTESQSVVVPLYTGDLKFDLDHPIETLGVFENDNIQKVYWVDGKNQPRMINVCKVRQATNNNEQFDFIAKLNLNEEITIDRIDGSGLFAPGTIQYSFTYYNKYGRQSNIFYTSLLHYISYVDRGGNPEDSIANSFEITVNNVQKNDFDYLRIYSIHRTSENAVPTVKRVTDIELATIEGTSVKFIDTGLIGNTIDPTELLYLGGEYVIPQTITQKDNTIFLGNLELNRDSIPDTIKTNIQNSLTLLSITTDFKENKIKSYDKSSLYNYVSTLNYASPGFKLGEHYRLGIQFQHESGKWSEPVFLKDYTLSTAPVRWNTSDNRPIRKAENDVYSILETPVIKCTINMGGDTYNTLNNKKYKKVRGVCIFPTFHDRLVLTQGMLCPTVYDTRNRMKSTPFSQSSWFLRPILPNTSYSDNGTYLSFYHLEKLHNEIQSTPGLNTPDHKDFHVDQSILTMHSPDIEWDTRFNNFDFSKYRLRLIGAVKFTKTASAVDIQTETPAFNNNRGFVDNHDKDTFLNSAGLWTDAKIAVNVGNDGEVDYKAEDTIANYIIYPWHRSGSLNNDENRSDGTTRTAVLKQKKLSNLQFAEYNTYFRGDHVNLLQYSLSKVQLFSSDQMELLKIPSPHISAGIPDITYYGNVDTLLSGNIIPMTTSGQITEQTDDDNYKTITETPGPVRMKYKSTNHLVFSLAYDSYRPVILPNTHRGSTYAASDMPWLSNYNIPATSTPINIDFDIESVGTLTAEDVLDGQTIIETRTGRVLVVSKRSVLGTVGNYYVSFDTYPESTIGKIFETLDSRLTLEPGDDGKHKYIGTSTPSVVIPFDENADSVYNVQQKNLSSILDSSDTLTPQGETAYPYLYLGELFREPNPETDFGGTPDEVLKAGLWIPAGEPVDISNGNVEVEFTQGDTWYTRYDCLKTYAFTPEDENQVVEIGSFLCESRVNGDGRYDRNRGQVSNLNMSPKNFNLFNPVYNNKDNFFNYRILDNDFYNLNKFSNQITWSKEKQNAADVDLWTNISMANTFDLDGTMGPINALRTWKDTIYSFQNNAISIISFNPRVQIPTSDGVPIEIANSYKLEGKVYISDKIGCSNKQTIAITPSGIYFIDPNSKELYNVAAQQLTNVSNAHSMSNWFKNNELKKSFYDSNRNDLYIENENDCIVYSEILGQFTSFMSYNDTPAMFNIGSNFYAFRDEDSAVSMHSLFTGNYNYFFNTYRKYWLQFISNQDSALDKIFSTVELRVDFWDTAADPPERIDDKLFSRIEVENEYQKATADLEPNLGVNRTNAKKKFRVWRIQIPRVDGTEFNRIRNTWTKIKLISGNDQDIKMELHDLSVQYFI